MKSFFKKLAFVMALAMVVTMAAPAAQKAVAAEDKKPLAIAYQEGAAIKTLNLKNVGDEEDLRFLYAPANYKELGVTWSSSNPNVVSVDDNGLVKAEAEGNATISVAIGTETASIDVYCVNMKTFEATIGTPENRAMETATIKVDDSIDFAFYGIEDYSANRYNCEWFPVDPEGCIEVCGFDTATPGLVTAKKAGTAKLTLAVINLKTMQRTDVKSVTITVPATEPEVTEVTMEVINERSNLPVNTTQNKVVVKFSEATNIKDLDMFRVFTADDDKEGIGEITEEQKAKGYEDFYVKGFTPNADKTVWTIETYEDFTDGVIYDIKVNKEDKEYKEVYEFTTRFTASVGAVAEVIVKGDNKAALATEDLPLVAETLSVKLYDAKGVDVTTRKVNGLANNDDANIRYELTEYSDTYSLFYNQIEFYEYAIANVYAIYDNVDVSKPVESAPLPVAPGSRNAYGVEKVIDWTIIDLDNPNDKPNWSATVKQVPAGETNYVIVTLLKDTRGAYFCTHQRGCGANKYQGQTVYWTENTDAAFWLNGFYVEYKAMHPDTMLVETDGEIASYELGNARFALYLYNQNYYGNDVFVKELYSQYVKVCHPRQLAGFDVSTTTINLMKNTEWEYCDAEDACYDDRTYDAFYSRFSELKWKVTLKDIHGDNADPEDADTADFTIKLTSETNNAVLAELVEEEFLDRLSDTGVVREFTIGANDFLGKTTKNQVKFRITDNTTKQSYNITINLIDMALTQIRYENEDDLDQVIDTERYDVIYSTKGDVVTLVSDVALIKEFIEEVRSYFYFEKFVVKDKKYTVDNRINDYDGKDKPSLDGWEILLFQQDKAGHDIGYDSNLWVADAAIKNDKLSADYIYAFSETSHDEDRSVVAGDRVLVVTDNSGKVYPVMGTVYKNPLYKDLPSAFDDLEAPAVTTGLGVYVKPAGEATSASGSAVTVYTQYGIDFRTVVQTQLGKELVYAKDGTYTATIRTVEYVDQNDIVYFAKETGLTDKVTFTVKNTNAQVTYASRDLVTKDASITDYIYDATKTITKEIGNDYYVKELILEAFNFNLGGAAWGEKWQNGVTVADLSQLDSSDILYYEYTVTPSNNQLVINSVTFKVPAERAGDNTPDGNGYGWYRSTATVNKSITFND